MDAPFLSHHVHFSRKRALKAGFVARGDGKEAGVFDTGPVGNEKSAVHREKIAPQHQKLMLQNEKIVVQDEKIAVHREKIVVQRQNWMLQIRYRTLFATATETPLLDSRGARRAGGLITTHARHRSISVFCGLFNRPPRPAGAPCCPEGKSRCAF